MTFSALIAFTLIMSAGIVTPGPTVLLALNNAARFGIKRAAYGIIGAVAADMVLVALIALGMGAVLAASETLFVTLKWVGAAWLAYMGLRMILSSGGGVMSTDAVSQTPARKSLFFKSFFVAMSNPKYYIFMTALLPQFVDTSHAAMPQYAALATIIVVLDVLAMLFYATIGMKSVRMWKASGVKWMNRISGSLLILIAGSVAIYRKG